MNSMRVNDVLQIAQDLAQCAARLTEVAAHLASDHQPLSAAPPLPLEALPASSIPVVLTVAQTAERLSVSKVTVYRLINSGQLQSITVGARLRILEEDLRSFLQRTVTIK